MNRLLLVVFSLSATASLLALALLLFGKLLSNKFSKRWHYYIWLVVVLRLLVPLSPQANLTGYLLERAAASQAWDGTFAAAPGAHENMQLVTGVLDGNPAAHQAAAADDSAAPLGPPTLLTALWISWLSAAVFLLAKRIADYRTFCRQMKACSSPAAGLRLNSSYQALCAELRIRRPPPVYVGEKLISPMLVGLFRPFIVIPLPFQDGGAAVEYALRHELIHYKRGDAYYKWLVQLARCLHWYNPLLPLIARRINHYCELSCDEAVIRGMDDEQKYQYGETLLAAIPTAPPAGAIASFPMSADARQIKERLDSILQYRKRSKGVMGLSLLLATLLAVGATMMGAYAATSPQTDSLTSQGPPQAAAPGDAAGNPTAAKVSAYLEESPQWQKFLQRSRDSGEQHPTQTDSWPQYMAYQFNGVSAGSLGNGFVVDQPIQVRLSVEYISGRMQELQIVDGDGKPVFGIPTLGSGQYEFNLYPTESTHKISMELSDYAGNVLIENIGPAADPLEGPSSVLDITPEAFRVQRYGSFSLTQDQPVNLQLSWSGNEPVIFLYTAADYSDEELIAILQAGLQGLSLGDFRSDYTYGNAPTLYLAANALGTMTWERTAPESGTYAVYLLLANGVENLQGDLQFGARGLQLAQQ